MDIKDLNKPQLILLAVLLSFIVSIATGITTVTLMQQMPVSVTTPISRVVQQTVEKIQQVEGKTVVQTVVVKEEDLVVDAIAKNKSSTFAVSKEVLDADGKISEASTGRGFAISSDGIVVVDGGGGNADNLVDKGVYYLKNDGGKFKANFVAADKAGFSFMKIGAPVNGTDKLVFTVPAFGDLSKMKIGQKILVLGGTISSSIFEGLNDSKNLDLTVPKSNAGALVLNLDGEALGIALAGDASSFAPIKTITDALAAPTPIAAPSATTAPTVSATTPPPSSQGDATLQPAAPVLAPVTAQ